jgi:hypothetical protein
MIHTFIPIKADVSGRRRYLNLAHVEVLELGGCDWAYTVGADGQAFALADGWQQDHNQLRLGVDPDAGVLK